MVDDVKEDIDAQAMIPRGRSANATTRTTLELRRRLAKEPWAAGDRLPSEPALAEQLGVSRVTVRAALAKLESEGLVNRRHGSGTYINSLRPLVNSLHINMGADHLITSGGQVAGLAEMSWRRVHADQTVATLLGIAPETPVIHLYRVRTADDVAVTIANDYFPASLLPAGATELGPSLYRFLSEVCGVHVAFGIATVEPALVGEDYGRVLDVAPTELCMVLRQVDYNADERPVSYSVEHHLASAFDFQLVRQGPSGLDKR